VNLTPLINCKQLSNSGCDKPFRRSRLRQAWRQKSGNNPMLEFTPPLPRSLCAVAPSSGIPEGETVLRELPVCVLPHGTRPAQPLTLPMQEIQRRMKMSLGTILIIVVLLMLVGVIPAWPHSTSWGYGPSSIVGIILIVLVVLLLMGRL
jgi:hypothetical protein